MDRLVIVHEGSDKKEIFFLDKAMVTIGRNPANGIAIENEFLSNCHAELERCADGTYWLRDRGSRNGTFVNDERVKEAKIRAGDTIRFGLLACSLEGSGLKPAGDQARPKSARPKLKENTTARVGKIKPELRPRSSDAPTEATDSFKPKPIVGIAGKAKPPTDVAPLLAGKGAPLPPSVSGDDDDESAAPDTAKAAKPPVALSPADLVRSDKASKPKELTPLIDKTDRVDVAAPKSEQTKKKADKIVASPLRPPVAPKMRKLSQRKDVLPAAGNEIDQKELKNAKSSLFSEAKKPAATQKPDTIKKTPYVVPGIPKPPKLTAGIAARSEKQAAEAAEAAEEATKPIAPSSTEKTPATQLKTDDKKPPIAASTKSPLVSKPQAPTPKVVSKLEIKSPSPSEPAPKSDPKQEEPEARDQQKPTKPDSTNASVGLTAVTPVVSKLGGADKGGFRPRSGMDQKDNLDKEVVRLRSQLAEIQESIRKARAEKASLTKVNEEQKAASKKIENLGPEVALLEEKNSALREEQKSLEATLNEKEAKLKEVEARNQEIVQATDHLAELQEKEKAAATQLVAVQSDVKKSKQDQENLTRSHSWLERQISGLKDDVSEREERLSDLEKQVAKLDKLYAEKSDAIRKIDDDHSAAESLGRRLSAVQEEVSVGTAVLEQLRADENRLGVEVSASRKRRDVLKSELKKLEVDVEKARVAAADASKFKEQAATKIAAAEEAEREREGLQTEVGKLQRLRVEITEKLDRANAELEERQAQIKELPSQEARVSELADQRKLLDAKVGSARTELDSLQRELASTREEAALADTGAATLREELKSLSASVEAARGEIEETRAGADLIVSKRDEAKMQIGALQKQVEELSSTSEQLNSAREELSVAETELGSYRAESDQVAGRLEELHAELNQIRDQRDTLQQEIDDRAQKRSQLEVSIDQIEAASQKAKEEHANILPLVDEITKTKAALTEVLDQKSVAGGELETLRDEAAALREEIGRLKAERKDIADLDRQQGELERVVGGLSERHESMESMLEAKEADCSRLEGEIDELRRRRDEMTNDLESIRDSSAEVRAELGDLKAQRDEVGSLVAQRDTFEKELADLHRDKAGVSKEIDELALVREERKLEADQLDHELEQVRQAVDERLDQKARVQAEIDDLDSAREKADQNQERVRAETDALDNSVESIRTDLASLRGKRDAVQADLAEIEERLGGRRKELANADSQSEEIAAAKQAELEGIAAKFAGLTTQSADVENQVIAQRDELKSLTQAATETQEEIEKLEASRHEARSEADSAQEELEELRAELSGLQLKVETKHEEKGRLEEETNGLVKRAEASRKDLERAESSREELEKLEAAKVALASELERLRGQVAETKKHSLELHHFRELGEQFKLKAQILEQEEVSRRKEVEHTASEAKEILSAINEARRAQQGMEQRAQEIEESLSSREQRLARLDDALAERESELSGLNSSRSELSLVIDELRGEVAELVSKKDEQERRPSPDFDSMDVMMPTGSGFLDADVEPRSSLPSSEESKQSSGGFFVSMPGEVASNRLRDSDGSLFSRQPSARPPVAAGLAADSDVDKDFRQRIDVLNLSGTGDAEQATGFWDNSGKEAMPVGVHGLALATGGTIRTSLPESVNDRNAVLVLAGKDLDVALEAVTAIKGNGSPVLLAWPDHLADWFSQLIDGPEYSKLRRIVAIADVAIATEHAFMDALSKVDQLTPRAYFPSPYPITHPDWDGARTPEQRSGILIGGFPFGKLSGLESRKTLKVAAKLAARTGHGLSVFGEITAPLIAEIDAAGLGTSDVQIIAPPASFQHYIKIVGKHLVVVDPTRGAHRMGGLAGDALLTRAICIGGSTNLDRLLFPELAVHDQKEDQVLDHAVHLITDLEAYRGQVADAVRLAVMEMSFDAAGARLRDILSTIGGAKKASSDGVGLIP